MNRPDAFGDKPPRLVSPSRRAASLAALSAWVLAMGGGAYGGYWAGEPVQSNNTSSHSAGHAEASGVSNADLQINGGILGVGEEVLLTAFGAEMGLIGFLPVAKVANNMINKPTEPNRQPFISS